jgi:hypothetical protein
MTEQEDLPGHAKILSESYHVPHHDGSSQDAVEQGNTLEVNGEILACQIVNGQPAMARFSEKNYVMAKELAATKGLHLMGALSDVGYNDPAMMRGLARKQLTGRQSSRSTD